MQLDLFSDVSNEKKKQYIRTAGLPINYVKYGVNKNDMPYSVPYDERDAIIKFISNINGFTYSKAEQLISKCEQNEDNWYEFQDNSMYIF